MKKIVITLGIIAITNINSYSIEKKQLEKTTIEFLNNNLNSIEQQLIIDLKKLDKDPEYATKFREKFYKIIDENPETLNYPFTKLRKETGLYIATSTDNRFRIYSWDNNSGGTMRFFDQIIQYKGDKKIMCNLKVSEEDAQSFISKIYSVETNQKETIYLTINNSIFSTSWVSQSIFAYKIANGKLSSTSVFKTKKKMLSSIQCEFDFFSVVDRPERPVELITLKNKTLNIPLINEEGTVTTKNIIYKWNGENFIYEGAK